jgi:hypothetical protein
LAISVFTYGAANIQNGRSFFQGAYKAAFFGALSGAVSFGIGTASQSLFSNKYAQAGFQALAHGISGGAMGELQGGQFKHGFVSGAISSVVSSGANALGTGPEIMIAAGGLSGGLGSWATGGSFWDGVKQGLITSALNHAMHMAFQNDPVPTKSIAELKVEVDMLMQRLNNKLNNQSNFLSGVEISSGLASYSVGNSITKSGIFGNVGAPLKIGDYKSLKVNLFGNISIRGKAAWNLGKGLQVIGRGASYIGLYSSVTSNQNSAWKIGDLSSFLLSLGKGGFGVNIGYWTFKTGIVNFNNASPKDQYNIANPYFWVPRK